MAHDRDWRFERAVARVEPTVEEVVAEFATSYVGRPVQRRDINPSRPLPGITWSIDGDLVVEFVHRGSARDQLLVHDVAILRSLKKQLRTRHVDIVHVGTTWEPDQAAATDLPIGACSDSDCEYTAIDTANRPGGDRFVENSVAPQGPADDRVRVQVHRITGEDAAVLKQVRLTALADAPSAFGSTYAVEANRPDAEWTQRANAGSEGIERATFFARLDDEVVGLVGGYRVEPPSATVELVSMWVAPHARSRGVGAALVDAVIRWAGETKATSVALWVTRGNAAAETLYLSKSFVATGEVQPLPSDPSRDEVRMEFAVP